jgi:hypothetical protein
MSEFNRLFRTGFAVAATAIGLWFAPGLPTAVAQSGPESDWLQYVPAEARLYIEIRNLGRIRRYFQQRGMWRAVQTLSERAESATDETQSWQDQAQRILGMSRDDAVTRVLGRRMAVIAPDPYGWKQGLILAQLANTGAVDALLREWSAQRDWSVKTIPEYEVRAAGGFRLAKLGTLLLMGPLDDSSGLWRRTVNLMAGNPLPNWAQQAHTTRLLRDLPVRADLLFIAAGDKPDEAGRPRAMAAGVRLATNGMIVEVKSTDRLPAGASASRPCDPLPAGLPDDTIVCWSGRFDAVEWLTGAAPDSPVAAAWNLVLGARRLVGDDLLGLTTLERLGPHIVFAMGPESDAAGAPFASPALTLLIEAREPPAVADDLKRLASFLALYVNTQLARAGATSHTVRVASADVDGVALHTLPIGEALSAHTECPWLTGVELAWAQTSDRLIVSTSSRQVRRLLHSGESQRDPLDADQHIELKGLANGSPARHWLFVRGHDLAAMMQSWLDFARDLDPRMLQHAWWTERAAQRARGSERLGVALRSRTLNGVVCAEVVDIEAGSPAARALRAGDLIVSLDGRPLESASPAREAAERFAHRRNNRLFPVAFLRDGKRQVEAIELAGPPVVAFDPVAMIRPLILIGRRIQSLSLVYYADERDQASARVVVRWRS